ncbi:collagen, type I, alpha 1b-like [Pseudopipra pipra]|uniref:collagen, type I, alpha 1b-like n=1 Tax=Pseudopipra pipra TaxID=415032 RepID=UPI00313A38D0
MKVDVMKGAYLHVNIQLKVSISSADYWSTALLACRRMVLARGLIPNFVQKLPPLVGPHLPGEGRGRAAAAPVTRRGRVLGPEGAHRPPREGGAETPRGSSSSAGATPGRGGGEGLPETPRGYVTSASGGSSAGARQSRPARPEGGGQSGAPSAPLPPARGHGPGSGSAASAGTRRAHAPPGPAGAPGMRGGGGRAASGGGRARALVEPAGHRPRAPRGLRRRPSGCRGRRGGSARAGLCPSLCPIRECSA